MWTLCRSREGRDIICARRRDQPIQRVYDFAEVWYGRHLDPDWRKWTIEEASGIFKRTSASKDPFGSCHTQPSGFETCAKTGNMSPALVKPLFRTDVDQDSCPRKDEQILAQLTAKLAGTGG